MLLDSLVLASGNKGKLNELTRLFSAYPIRFIPQNDLDVPEAIEDGLSFVENAIIKARNACHHSQLPALADDSGLEVEALNGEPGIYSARYSGRHGDDNGHIALLLEKLIHQPLAQRRARFHCALALMRHASDPSPLVCQASWEGYVADQPAGAEGFGYDPIFWLPDHHCTAAQLSPELKNQISHRGRALQLLVQSMVQNGWVQSV